VVSVFGITDIDLFIRPELENARRTLEALKEFGYDVTDLNEEDLLSKKVLVRPYLAETDIHPFVGGAVSIGCGRIGFSAGMETRKPAMPPLKSQRRPQSSPEFEEVKEPIS